MTSVSSSTEKNTQAVSNIYLEMTRFTNVEWCTHLGHRSFVIPLGSEMERAEIGPDWHPGVWREFVQIDPLLDAAEQYLRLAKKYGLLRRYGTSPVTEVTGDRGEISFIPGREQIISHDDFKYWDREIGLLRLAFEIGEALYSDDMQDEIKSFKQSYFDFDHIISLDENPFLESPLEDGEEDPGITRDHPEAYFENDPTRWLPYFVQRYFVNAIYSEGKRLTIPTSRRRLCYLLRRANTTEFHEMLRIIFNEKTKNVRFQSLVHPLTGRLEFRLCPPDLLSLLWVQMAQEHTHRVNVRRCTVCGQFLLGGRSDRRTCGPRCRKQQSRMGEI